MRNRQDHPAEPPIFDMTFREELRDLFRWRRDVRHFKSAQLPEGLVEQLIEIACLAPSVGLSQPWHFVLVDDMARRAGIQASFEVCNAQALAGYEGDRAALYAQLKLAGLVEAPTHIAVFADRDTEQGHALGRRTMPETVDYSAVMAIHTLWLAARAEGIGLGWVSILDPEQINVLLDVPDSWGFIGYLCLGYPEQETGIPELERTGWEHRRTASTAILRR